MLVWLVLFNKCEAYLLELCLCVNVVVMRTAAKANGCIEARQFSREKPVGMCYCSCV